jgi:hypothetical protein
MLTVLATLPIEATIRPTRSTKARAAAASVADCQANAPVRARNRCLGRFLLCFALIRFQSQ